MNLNNKKYNNDNFLLSRFCIEKVGEYKNSARLRKALIYTVVAFLVGYSIIVTHKLSNLKKISVDKPTKCSKIK